MLNLDVPRGDVTFKLNPSGSFTQGVKRSLSFKGKPEIRTHYIDSRLAELETGFPRGFSDYPNFLYDETDIRRALGLSEVSNFTGEKMRYGTRGISSKGRNEVLESVVTLELAFGNENLSFITTTIPFSIGRVTTEQLSSITDAFNKQINEHLLRKGLEPHWVYVEEVHPNALRDKGEIRIHWHYVVRGRESRFKRWAISKTELKELWEAALVKVLGSRMKGVSLAAATQIAAIRKSASRYISKYMSKECKTLLTELPESEVNHLPRRWWGRSRSMKSLRGIWTVSLTGQEASELMEYLEAHEECPYRYFQYKRIAVYDKFSDRLNWNAAATQVGEWICGAYGSLERWAIDVTRSMFPRPAAVM